MAAVEFRRKGFCFVLETENVMSPVSFYSEFSGTLFICMLIFFKMEITYIERTERGLVQITSE